MNRRTALSTAAAAGLAAILAACGGSSSGSGASAIPTSDMAMSPAATSATTMAMPADVNDQDGTFASGMINHHRQAIEMAELAADRSTNPKVLALAKRIKAAQAPEIDTMFRWLTDWGMSVPADMSGMEMGDSMPGAMSQADMKKLGAMKGADYDKMFLTMMVDHHKGAITMARTEVASGMNAQAKALAQKVIKDQATEITEMQSLLG
jgi:uncharacterized protein (DUF305 family)